MLINDDFRKLFRVAMHYNYKLLFTMIQIDVWFFIFWKAFSTFDSACTYDRS